MQGSHGSARTEAERLVATVLAMASANKIGDLVSGMVAQASGAAGHAPTSDRTQAAPASAGPARAGWATGSAECCVCPFCKVIAGLRDPGPETAERLATGAGDFAAGVASLMRAFSAAAANPAGSPSTTATASTSTGTTAAAEPTAAPAAGSAAPHDSAVWAAATAAADAVSKAAAGHAQARASAARTGDDPWAAATAAADTAATRTPVPRAARPAEPTPRPARVAPPAPGADPWAAATSNHDAGTGDEARPDDVV